MTSLSDPEVHSDQDKLRNLSRRMKHLEPIVKAYQEYAAAVDDAKTAKEMITDATSEEREILRADLEEAENTIERLEAQLKILLLPKDPNDGRRVIVEIRGAEGGEEGNLFAKDLYEMYVRYSDRMGWKADVLGSNPSPMGGYNEITFTIDGDDAWSKMKFEGGTHRVQRVPATESQGRVHTSSATVLVLPEADPIEVAIEDKDLKIDVYRSTGPGGQSVNTTDSAVRITHLPTGIVVSMQDEKSQIQNRAKAMQVLRARLLQHEQDLQDAEMSVQRRSQVGSGGRSEKIRTYNYKDNRVTDHRIGLTIHKLDRVLMGELDEVTDALAADTKSKQLSQEA